MRGRKPTPTALKILRGNPGKQKLPTDEPTPEPGAPTCPEHLDKIAKAEWKRMTAELLAVNCLSKMDRAALAAYCVCWSRWVQAEQKVQETGPVVAGEMGEPVKNPYLTIAEKAMAEMKAFLVEFGMTPSSRARVKATAPAEKPSAKKRFFQ